MRSGSCCPSRLAHLAGLSASPAAPVTDAAAAQLSAAALGYSAAQAPLTIRVHTAVSNPSTCLLMQCAQVTEQYQMYGL